MELSKSHVIVIGGGFAGLAAATALAERGCRVTVLERRPRLGGRAYSFTDETTGDTVDNGQHLMMGCYHETMRFLDRIGSSSLVNWFPAPRVDFLDREGAAALVCPQLPAPLHLLAGMVGLRGISVAEKLSLLRVGLALQTSKKNFRAKYGDLTVAQWLTKYGQSARIRERFWDPFVIATINEDPEKAAAVLLIQVLNQGFGGSFNDSKMVISKVGLSELYTEQSVNFVTARGGEVRLQTGVKRLIVENGTFSGVELPDGAVLKADACISTVPPADLNKFAGEFFLNLDVFGAAPIISVNLWFDRPVMDAAFAGLIGTRVQWAFNKSAFAADAGEGNHLALIISAAYDFARTPNEELVNLALDDLKAVLPRAREARLTHSRVVKEFTATFSATVPNERRRPTFKTDIGNFFLGGDWVNTGLPATIESAVLSGHRCADLIRGSAPHR